MVLCPSLKGGKLEEAALAAKEIAVPTGGRSGVVWDDPSLRAGQFWQLLP